MDFQSLIIFKHWIAFYNYLHTDLKINSNINKNKNSFFDIKIINHSACDFNDYSFYKICVAVHRHRTLLQHLFSVIVVLYEKSLIWSKYRINMIIKHLYFDECCERKENIQDWQKSTKASKSKRVFFSFPKQSGYIKVNILI